MSDKEASGAVWPLNGNAVLFATGVFLAIAGAFSYGPAVSAVVSGFYLMLLGCTNQIL